MGNLVQYRSILFSRIVRDVLKLDIVLVYFTEKQHLLAATKLPEDNDSLFFQKAEQRQNPASAVRMFPQREVEPRATFEDSRSVGEFPEAPLSVVGPHPGMADATERHALHHHMHANLIDAATAVLN